jgi:aminopeptidase-like protein
MRTPHGQFPEYHTSADNLEFIDVKSLDDSFSKCLSILNVIETNAIYLNQNPKCEPQLGKRGLYSAIGGQSDGKTQELAMLWVLNLSDGKNSLIDIADRSGIPFAIIHNAAEALKQSQLLKECA